MRVSRLTVPDVHFNLLPQRLPPHTTPVQQLANMIPDVLTSHAHHVGRRHHDTRDNDVLDVPGTDILLLVMPVLTQFDEPSFETVGEVLECFRQVFEVRGTIVLAMTSNDLCRLSRDWSSFMTAV